MLTYNITTLYNTTLYNINRKIILRFLYYVFFNHYLNHYLNKPNIKKVLKKLYVYQDSDSIRSNITSDL